MMIMFYEKRLVVNASMKKNEERKVKRNRFANILENSHQNPRVTTPQIALFKDNRTVENLSVTGRIKEVDKILILTYTIKNVYEGKIKLDNIKHMKQSLNTNHYMFKFEIKQDNRPIDIYDTDQKFLGFLGKQQA